jgi:hypothetical protein
MGRANLEECKASLSEAISLIFQDRREDARDPLGITIFDPDHSETDFPGLLHHIMCRGIERRKVFDTDADQHFLERLGEILLETGTICYVWSLLDNRSRTDRAIS